MTSTENVQQTSVTSSPNHAAGQRFDTEIRCKQQFEAKPTTLGGMIEGSEPKVVHPPKPEPTDVEIAMDCRDNNYGVHDISSKVQAPRSDSANPAGRRPAAMAGKRQVTRRNTEMGEALDHQHDGLPDDLQVNNSQTASHHPAGRPLGGKEFTRKCLLSRETQMANAMNHDHNGVLTGDAPSISSECRMDPATAQDRAAGQSAFVEASGYSRKVCRPRATNVGRALRMAGKRCSVNRRRESNVFDSRSSQVVRRYSSGLGMESIRAAGRTPSDKNRGMIHFTERKQGEDRDEMLQRKIREAALTKKIAAAQNNQGPSAGLRVSPRMPAKKTFDVVHTKDVLVEQQYVPKSLLRSQSVVYSSGVAAGQRMITTGGGIGMVNIEKQKPTYYISQMSGKKVANHPAGQRSSSVDFTTKCREIDWKAASRDMTGIFKSDLANNPQSSNAGRVSFLGKSGCKPHGIRVFKETTSSFCNLGF
eukprot:GEMP01035425.1.p1 GENE.GEMP01035425.1~~GEMP01035425.1.p1  ORF type:complete len:476 (+),score=66.23 GEMP01035425.1:71-1498(+)